MPPEIDRPIFIVGCGRSGTTILYDLLCGHPDLAWFSSWGEYCPQLPQTAALSRLRNSAVINRWLHKRLPHPVEGYRQWDHVMPVEDSPSDPPLTEADASPEVVARARKAVSAHLRYQGKPRFINKNTRNSRRMRFLDAIFDEAVFIHIVRDPRAAVGSMLRVHFWPELKIWCEGKVTPREWAGRGRDPVALASRLWVAEVRRIMDDGATLPAHRYRQLRYEDLTAYPQQVLGGILSICGLSWNRRFEKHVAKFRLSNMNKKYSSELSGDTVARIDEVTGPLASCLGYRPATGLKLAGKAKVPSPATVQESPLAPGSLQRAAGQD